MSNHRFFRVAVVCRPQVSLVCIFSLRVAFLLSFILSVWRDSGDEKTFIVIFPLFFSEEREKKCARLACVISMMHFFRELLFRFNLKSNFTPGPCGDAKFIQMLALVIDASCMSCYVDGSVQYFKLTRVKKDGTVERFRIELKSYP